MFDRQFALSLYDMVSAVIPGAAFLFLVYVTQPSLTTSFAKYSVPALVMLTILTTLSFILGQLFLVFGNWIYYFYKHPKHYTNKDPRKYIYLFLHWLTKVLVRENYSQKFAYKKELAELVSSKLRIKKIDNQALYHYCDLLAIRDSSTERELLLAKEGTFRSFSSLAIFSFIYANWMGGLGMQPFVLWVALFVILRLSLYGHHYFQRIRRLQVYTYAFAYLIEREKAK
jgi:hypothetical protein